MRKKGLFTLLALVIFFSLLVSVGCSSQEKVKENENPDNAKKEEKQVFIKMGTGTTSGAFYPIGTGMANIINNYVKNINVSVQSTGGAAENTSLVGTKQADTGLAASSIPLAAIKGEAPFEGKKMEIQALGGLWSQSIQIVTLNPDIKTVSDLKGKRIALGAVGSGSEVAAKQLLEYHGLTYDNLKPEFLSFSESATKMKDGHLDASILRTTVPAAALTDLSLTSKMYFVKLEDEAVSKMLKDDPSYSKGVIKAGTYKGVNEDVGTIGQKILFIVRPDLDQEIAYNMIKALMDHIDEFHEIHPSTKGVQIEEVADVPIPLHPGAEKYFKEKGLL
ncbi:MAG: TAXI family TRAP transporter solute-binding subunit [Bacillota bacterium]